MNLAKAPFSILWLQVFALAAMQGAITLCWVIYNIYLGKLLTQLGLPAPWAVTLLIVENLLAVLLEPLMGTLSDRQQRWVGHRFLLIAWGGTLSAALFLAIPTVTLLGNPTPVLQGLLLALIILWALAMTMFRSPALALLGKYASLTALPQAASVLLLVGAIAGSLSTFVQKQILSWGPGMTFALGAAVLLVVTACLRWVDAHMLSSPVPPLAVATPIVLSHLGLIAATGAGIGLGYRLIQMNFGDSIGWFFAAHILSALPAGTLAVRLGNQRVMMIGALATAVLLGLVLFKDQGAMGVGTAIALGICFSLIVNGSIPFALSLAPADKPGLGVGLYFGGSALAAMLFGLGVSQFGSLFKALSLSGGMGAFLFAGLCVATAHASLTKFTEP
ncbi:MAG: MFS transporter [Scytolyngbya sp. HA4215-MV1]|jgi:Na+/melibiose symporter-like transporter|nr:MFS transporter [Scytolyngbya sp. HA4215-MV1]